MDKQWFDTFSDRDHWEALSETFIKTGTAPGKLPFSHVADLWEYFKYCILTDNRFFFSHPLLDVVKRKIDEHVVVLPQNTTLFRARIDSQNSLRSQAENLMQVKILTKLKEEKKVPGQASIDEMIEKRKSNIGYDVYCEQNQSGFEGFPPTECLTPPASMVSNGRCNMPYSAHLYAAADIHTSVAETHPYISDTISVASLCIEKELRIIDFCFDWGDQDQLSDWFYLSMSSDFSAVNKGKENIYFVTQYLTMLVKSMGYDGLKFKSSLVMDGINYVLFDESVCKPISSKLYTVVQVHYDVLSVSIDSHLKDADGTDIDDPPLSRRQ